MIMRQLGEKEEEVMSILWQLQNGFINDILNQMPEEDRPPYNTVSSIVRKLVSEGHIGYEAFGKTHRYFPVLKKEDYRTNAFQKLFSQYFDSSPSAMLSFFLEDQKIENKDLAQLLQKIKEKESKS
jgi:BlaI family transcriptional regulator, penicillinase repressor